MFNYEYLDNGRHHKIQKPIQFIREYISKIPNNIMSSEKKQSLIDQLNSIYQDIVKVCGEKQINKFEQFYESDSLSKQVCSSEKVIQTSISDINYSQESQSIISNSTVKEYLNIQIRQTVSQLNLQNEQIRKIIQKKLNLSSCEFCDEDLIQMIPCLQKVEELNLRNNKLTQTICNFLIFHCKNLKFLNVSMNQIEVNSPGLKAIKQVLPDCIIINNSNSKQQPNPKYNQIISIFRNFIKSRKSIIQKLNINSTKVDLKLSKLKDDQLVLLISHIKEVTSLDISANLLTDKFGRYLPIYCKKLISLNISDNNIGIQFLKDIKQIYTNLLEIKLACIPYIDDEYVQFLSENMVKCQSIDLSYTKITNKAIYYLKSMRYLKNLALWTGKYNPNRYYKYFYLNKSKKKYKNAAQLQLTQQSLDIIYDMKLISVVINLYFNDASALIQSLDPSVECIEIGGTLSQSAIQKIQNLKSLKRLYLLNTGSKIKIINSKRLKSLTIIDTSQIENLNFIKEFDPYYLKALNLSGQYIGESTLELLLVYKDTLQSLNLSKCKIQSTGTYKLQQFREVTWLDLSENPIKNSGLSIIINNMKNLKTLIIKQCEISRIQIYEKLKQFHSLIAYSNELDDEAVHMISQKLKNLTTLDLYLNMITQKGYVQIIKSLRKLTYLDIRANKIKYNNIQNYEQIKQLQKQIESLQK